MEPQLGQSGGAEAENVVLVAAKLHELFCGCAACEPDGDNDLWCDSIWLVLASRCMPTIRQCIGDMNAIAKEHCA